MQQHWLTAHFAVVIANGTCGHAGRRCRADAGVGTTVVGMVVNTAAVMIVMVVAVRVLVCMA